jgi:hypothetical protein
MSLALSGPSGSVNLPKCAIALCSVEASLSSPY